MEKYVVKKGKSYLVYNGDKSDWRWSWSPWDAKGFKSEDAARKVARSCGGQLEVFDPVNGRRIRGGTDNHMG